MIDAEKVDSPDTPVSVHMELRGSSAPKHHSLKLKELDFANIDEQLNHEHDHADDEEDKKIWTDIRFFPLDFDIKESLFKAKNYIISAKYMVRLFVEMLLIAGFGVLYVYGLSSIPFSRNSRFYYDPYMICFFYSLVLAITVIVIAYFFFVMLYGFKLSRPLLWWVVAPALVISSTMYMFVGGGVQFWFYGLDVIYMGYAGGTFLLAAFIMSRRVFPAKADRAHAKSLIMAYCIPLGVHVVVIALYAYVIIPFYRELWDPYVRGAFRLVVHPIVCTINLSIATLFCKKYPSIKHQHLTTGVVFGIWVESAMFGRFLIATVGSVEGTLGTSAVAGLLEILSRALILKQTKLINFILYKITGDFDFDVAKELIFMGQFVNNTMVVENTSIIVVPFLLQFFYKHRFVFDFSYTSTPPDVTQLAISAAVQLAIQLVVHFVSVTLEISLKIPVVEVGKQTRNVYVLWQILNFIQILTLIIYVFHTLPLYGICASTDPCTCNVTAYVNLSLLQEAGYCTTT